MESLIVSFHEVGGYDPSSSDILVLGGTCSPAEGTTSRYCKRCENRLLDCSDIEEGT